MLLGIIDPSSGTRRLLGRDRPLDAAPEVGYLPEERGLYPSMTAREAIAFMGALRGLPLAEGRRRADDLLAGHGLGEWALKPIRNLSKGMAQTVQLLGTIVHRPRLIVLDEPFSGLDAINQAKLEELIREEARGGATIIFSTHVIAHAERLCERIAIIAGGRLAFEGAVDEARDRLQPIVRLRTRSDDGPWRAAIPADARRAAGEWIFELPSGGPEPLLRALLDGGAGIQTLAIERPGLARCVRGDCRRRRGGRHGRSGGGVLMARILRSAFVIARRDFTATVFSRAFLFFLIGPLFPVLMVVIFGTIGGMTESDAERPVVAVIAARRGLSRARRRAPAARRGGRSTGDGRAAPCSA